MARRPTSARELDLVPIMNLVTILIPFLLLSASFVSLASIDSTLPAICPDPAPTPTAEPLGLRITVTPDGYRLEADQPLDAVDTDLPRARGPMTPDSWPLERLELGLERLKRAYPHEDTVVLVPSGSVPYEALIATMDTARGEHSGLFPGVVMAGGT